MPRRMWNAVKIFSQGSVMTTFGSAMLDVASVPTAKKEEAVDHTPVAVERVRQRPDPDQHDARAEDRPERLLLDGMPKHLEEPPEQSAQRR